jgi:hypothetical protein
MIQAALTTNKGPIGLIGINYENLRRLKAGMPLDINLDHITPPGTRMRRVVVHYADTYEQVIDDWAKDDIPVTDALMEEAKKMDELIKRTDHRQPQQ